MLSQVLGVHLFQPEQGQLEQDGQWLSPEALKHKVVICMKVKEGATAPQLERLVYMRNTKISGYDVGSGPATPGSHSLPDNKLPAVPEYAAYVDQSAAGGRDSKTGVTTALKSSYKNIKEAVVRVRGGSKTASPATSGGGAKAPAANACGSGLAPDDPAAVAAADTELQLAGEKDDTLTIGTSDNDVTASSDMIAMAEDAAPVSSAAALPAGLRSPPLAKVFEYKQQAPDTLLPRR